MICKRDKGLVFSSLSLDLVVSRGTCGLVAMTSAQHAEGHQLDPGQVYDLQRIIICRMRYNPIAYDIWLLQDRPEFESTLAAAMSSHRRRLGSTKTSLKGDVRSSATIEVPAAQWIRHRPTEPGIASSSPAGVMINRRLNLRNSSSTQTKEQPDNKKSKVVWTHWGLSPGPSACEADVIPLHHVPLTGLSRSRTRTIVTVASPPDRTRGCRIPHDAEVLRTRVGPSP